MKEFLSNSSKYFSIFMLVLVASCSTRKPPDLKSAKLAEHVASSHAKRFKIIKQEGYSQLIISNPWQGAGGIVQNWYLVPSGNKIPDNLNPAQIISVPVRKIISMSTTHMAMISALHEEASVRGFSGVSFIYNPVFIKMAGEGLISDVGYEDNLNKELILRINPDLVIAYGIGAESTGYVARLKELGIKVLFDADYLEEDPLGKSEWIKVFGALYLKEQMADSVFKSLEYRYNNLKTKVIRDAKSKPDVLLGLPFRDTWYISPGNSYVSRLIADAGGDYLWSRTESAFSMPVGIESVYIKAVRADFWLNTGTASSAAEIAAIDSRFTSLPAFREHHIYNNTRRANQYGGNDYWESGSLNPDVILNDIASILHPDLFPGYELFYYRKLN